MNYNDKQLQIIATAERLFACKGYVGTSVREIADVAGVNISMISYYFGSKEKLMEVLFGKRITDINLQVERLLHNEELGPLEKMECWVDSYIDKVIRHQAFFKIMICEQVINKNPVIVSFIYDLKKKNTEAIARLVKEGQQKGGFRKKIDVLLLMNTVMGSITQMILNRDFYKEYNNLQNIGEDQFFEHVKEKLSKHIKFILKALITSEAYC